MARETYSVFWSLVFGAFVAIKLAGTSLAAWSWWWLLMPIVPLIGMLVTHFGL